MDQEIDDITLGNQKWIGAIPALISIEIITNIYDTWVGFIIYINPPINKIPDPRAWGKKYLIAPSVFCCEEEYEIISGINDIILSSNPIHRASQLFLVKDIIVPISKVTENIKVTGNVASIKKRGIWNPQI